MKCAIKNRFEHWQNEHRRFSMTLKNKYLSMKNIKVSVLFLLLGSFSLHAQSLKSPDGKFEMNFQLKTGVPYYDLKYQGKTVVENSKLGLRLLRDGDIQFASEIENKDQKGKDLDNGFTKTAEKFDSKNENYINFTIHSQSQL